MDILNDLWNTTTGTFNRLADVLSGTFELQLAQQTANFQQSLQNRDIARQQTFAPAPDSASAPAGLAIDNRTLLLIGAGVVVLAVVATQ